MKHGDFTASNDPPVAVVTGASQGIGRAVALRLAEAGYHVWAVARRRAVLEEVCAAAAPGSITVGDCDLSDPSAIHELTQEIAGGSPNGLSVIVHSAGSYLHGELAATDVASLRREFVENVESVYLLTQSLLPALTPASTIVFMNSSQGVQTSSGNSQFGASMHALRGVADALREEVNGRGIRVTSIFLGRTATPRQERIYANNGWDYQPDLLLQPEDVAEFVTQVVQAVPSAELTEISMRLAMKSYDRRSGTDRRSPR